MPTIAEPWNPYSFLLPMISGSPSLQRSFAKDQSPLWASVSPTAFNQFPLFYPSKITPESWQWSGQPIVAPSAPDYSGFKPIPSPQTSLKTDSSSGSNLLNTLIPTLGTLGLVNSLLGNPAGSLFKKGLDALIGGGNGGGGGTIGRTAANIAATEAIRQLMDQGVSQSTAELIVNSIDPKLIAKGIDLSKVGQIGETIGPPVAPGEFEQLAQRALNRTGEFASIPPDTGESGGGIGSTVLTTVGETVGSEVIKAGLKAAGVDLPSISQLIFGGPQIPPDVVEGLNIATQVLPSTIGETLPTGILSSGAEGINLATGAIGTPILSPAAQVAAGAGTAAEAISPLALGGGEIGAGVATGAAEAATGVEAAAGGAGLGLSAALAPFGLAGGVFGLAGLMASLFGGNKPKWYELEYDRLRPIVQSAVLSALPSGTNYRWDTRYNLDFENPNAGNYLLPFKKLVESGHINNVFETSVTSALGANLVSPDQAAAIILKLAPNSPEIKAGMADALTQSRSLYDPELVAREKMHFLKLDKERSESFERQNILDKLSGESNVPPLIPFGGEDVDPRTLSLPDLKAAVDAMNQARQNRGE